MKKLIKTILLTLSLMLAFTSLNLDLVKAASGTSFSNAISISTGSSYSASISSSSFIKYYKFTNSTSGENVFTFDSDVNLYYTIYDTNQESITSGSVYSSSVVDKESLDLTSGDYYMVIEYWYSTGDYSFTMSFTSAGESFKETTGGINNAISSASSISTGTTYKGQIAINDKIDCYKFTLSTSGRVAITITKDMDYLEFYLYDVNQDELYMSYLSSSDTSSKITLDLTSGTYYLVYERYSSSNTGNYSFKVSFTSAGESFKETTGGINNAISSASSISTGTTYKGQIATNDKIDCYKFTLSTSGRIAITTTKDMDYLELYLYDVNQDEVYMSYLSSSDTSSKITLDLTSGTYYLVYERYSSSNTGNYSFKVSFTSAGESFKETTGGTNNSMSKASKISLNTTYKGQLAENDSKDYYKFTVSKKTSVTVSLSSSTLTKVYCYIYNSSGSQVKYGYDYDSDGISISLTATLSKGTYYVYVYESSCTGNYSLKVSNKLSSASLSTTTYTYNGKAKKPSVTVKNGAGTTLTKGTDYTVTYSSGRKSIGSYKVTIKGTGDYTGTITKTFKVNPKKVTISKAKSSSKKKLTVKWKKVSGSVKYKIAYRVKGTSTWKYKYVSSSTYSKTITGLKSGKTYQIKVRAYKKVSGTTYYGSWSKTKTVKVK